LQCLDVCPAVGQVIVHNLKQVNLLVRAEEQADGSLMLISVE
jgi:hypothetical protein